LTKFSHLLVLSLVPSLVFALPKKSRYLLVFARSKSRFCSLFARYCQKTRYLLVLRLVLRLGRKDSLFARSEDSFLLVFCSLFTRSKTRFQLVIIKKKRRQIVKKKLNPVKTGHSSVVHLFHKITKTSKNEKNEQKRANNEQKRAK
jgi:hypothetical protein